MVSGDLEIGQAASISKLQSNRKQLSTWFDGERRDIPGLSLQWSLIWTKHPETWSSSNGMPCFVEVGYFKLYSIVRLDRLYRARIWLWFVSRILLLGSLKGRDIKAEALAACLFSCEFLGPFWPFFLLSREVRWHFGLKPASTRSTGRTRRD